ncbi:hypothetical protein ESCOCP341M_24030 [Escherichia coli]
MPFMIGLFSPVFKSAIDALLVTTEKQISRLTWLLQPPGRSMERMYCNI